MVMSRLVESYLVMSRLVESYLVMSRLVESYLVAKHEYCLFPHYKASVQKNRGHLFKALLA